MRPASIRWFDRLFLSGMAFEFALRISDVREALHKADTSNTALFIGMAVVFFLIIGTFWFAISQLSSNIAKWAWTILLISIPIGLVTTATNPTLMFDSHFSIERVAFEVVRPLLYISATIMLFRSDARVWFANHGRSLDVSSVG